MEFIFKVARVEDVDEIVAMQKKLTEMLGLCNSSDDESLKNFIKEEIQEQNTIYYLAKNQGETIGVVCVDFSNKIEVDGLEYIASIPFIFVNEKYRQGKVAYNLFKLALKEIEQKGYKSFVMAVEENNPNKYLHFAIADQIIEEREEQQEDGGITKQYILGVTNINEVKDLSFKEIAQKSVYTKRNFEKMLPNLPVANNIDYIF